MRRRKVGALSRSGLRGAMASEAHKPVSVAPVSAKLTPLQTLRLQTLRRLGLVNTDTAAFARQWVDYGIEQLLKTHNLSIFTVDRMGQDESLSLEEAVWLPQGEDAQRKPRHGT